MYRDIILYVCCPTSSDRARRRSCCSAISLGLRADNDNITNNNITTIIESVCKCVSIYTLRVHVPTYYCLVIIYIYLCITVLLLSLYTRVRCTYCTLNVLNTTYMTRERFIPRRDDVVLSSFPRCSTIMII